MSNNVPKPNHARVDYYPCKFGGGSMSIELPSGQHPIPYRLALAEIGIGAVMMDGDATTGNSQLFVSTSPNISPATLPDVRDAVKSITADRTRVRTVIHSLNGE